ncbi:MAG: DNA-directed RNA polymerase subunit RpoH/Rpb5 C-terminal domain-containing protein [Nanoarchaeota archaeon]
MHILQSKHIKLNEKESEELLKRLNLSKAQLPKILSTDAGLPEGCVVGDIIKIERKTGDYFRVVV